MTIRKYLAPSVVALFGATIYVFAQVSVSTDGFDRWYLGNDQSDLYVQGLATGEERRITNTVMVEHAPDWSPDGRSIVYSGYRAGIETNHDLYMATIDGSELTQLTYTPQISEVHPTWSPDGSQIAFAAESGEGTISQLYSVSLASGEVSQISFSNSIHVSPAWSPDGETIAFVDIKRDPKPISSEIAILDVRTGSETRLTTHRSNRGSAQDPEWSPDGTRIVYTVGVYDEDRGVHYTPYVIDRFGGSPQRIRTELNLRYPAWSPSGRRIAFVSIRDSEPNRIVTMSMDGSNVQTLPKITASTFPQWSPDGSYILYLSQRRDPDARSLGSIIVYEDGTIYTTAEPNDLPPLTYATKPLGYAPNDKRWIYTELTVEEFIELEEEIKKQRGN